MQEQGVNNITNVAARRRQKERNADIWLLLYNDIGRKDLIIDTLKSVY